MVGGGFAKQFAIKLLLSGNSPVAHHSSQVNMTTKEYNFKYKSHLCLTFARHLKELSRKRAGYLSGISHPPERTIRDLLLHIPGIDFIADLVCIFQRNAPVRFLIADDFQDHKWPHSTSSTSALNPVITTQYSVCHPSRLLLFLKYLLLNFIVVLQFLFILITSPGYGTRPQKKARPKVRRGVDDRFPAGKLFIGEYLLSPRDCWDF